MNRTETTRRAWWPVGVGPAISAVALVVVAAITDGGLSVAFCVAVLALVTALDVYRHRAGDRPFWRRR